MLTVLIADDEQDTREGLKKLIPWSDLGIDSVFIAADGVEAFKLSEQIRPDIILSDIRMPKMNGIDFLEKIRPILPDSKIIFLSAYSDKEYFKSAIRFKAVRYIEKPLDLEEIKDAVCEAVKEVSGDKEIRRLIRQSETSGCEALPPEMLSSETDTREAAVESQYNIISVISEYIERHFADRSLNITKISKEIHISPSHLSHIYKRATGETVNAFITRYRIGQAQILLGERDRKLADIADSVGFSDHNYFTKAFRKACGLTPSQYRERRSGRNQQGS